MLTGVLAFQGANAHESKTKAPADIVDTAVAAGSFKTLATALKAAGLVETLKGPGPFTRFAPTDEAFAKLPAGTLESLTSAKTVNGQSVRISVDGGKVKVDGANVVETDVGAINGVIHVIDAVLLPKWRSAERRPPSRGRCLACMLSQRRVGRNDASNLV